MCLDSALVALDSEQGVALVASASGKRAIRYHVLIAADGPHSTVARCLGLPRLASVRTRQYTLPLV